MTLRGRKAKDKETTIAPKPLKPKTPSIAVLCKSHVVSNTLLYSRIAKPSKECYALIEARFARAAE